MFDESPYAALLIPGLDVTVCRAAEDVMVTDWRKSRLLLPSEVRTAKHAAVGRPVMKASNRRDCILRFRSILNCTALKSLLSLFCEILCWASQKSLQYIVLTGIVL